MTDKIDLVCLLKRGAPTFDGVFKIEVAADRDILDLKRLRISSPQSPSNLRKVGEADLTVYHVSVKGGDTTALQEAMRLIDQPGTASLGFWEIVGEVFPSPPAKHVHLIIKSRYENDSGDSGVHRIPKAVKQTR